MTDFVGTKIVKNEPVNEATEGARALFRHTTEVLDRETGATATDGGRLVPLLDHRTAAME